MAHCITGSIQVSCECKSASPLNVRTDEKSVTKKNLALPGGYFSKMTGGQGQFAAALHVSGEHRGILMILRHPGLSLYLCQWVQGIFSWHFFFKINKLNFDVFLLLLFSLNLLWHLIYKRFPFLLITMFWCHGINYQIYHKNHTELYLLVYKANCFNIFTYIKQLSLAFNHLSLLSTTLVTLVCSLSGLIS